MITKFGSLFAGHVDFEDMGFGATPVSVIGTPQHDFLAEPLERFGKEVMLHFKKSTV